MSVVTRIRLGIGLPILVFAIIGAISFRAARQVPVASGWVEHTLETLAKLKETAVSLNELVAAGRAGALNGIPETPQSLQIADTVRAEFQTLRRLTSEDPAQQHRLDTMEAALRDWQDLVRRATELRATQGVAAAAELMRGDGVRSLGARIRNAYLELEESEKALLEQRHRSAKASAQRSIWIIGVGTLAGIVLGCGAAIRISNRVTGPLRQLKGAAEAYGRGELSHRLTPTSTDELAVLKGAFNQMAARLEVTMGELQQQKAVLKGVLESMADGVIATDARGAMLFGNPAAARILGRDPASMVKPESSAAQGLFLPDGVTPFPSQDRPLTRAIRGESVDDLSIYMQHDGVPDGAWLSVSARPLHGAEDQISGGVAVFRDITEHKLAEERLTKERNLLRTLVDHLREYVFVKDADCRFLLVNKALAESLGIADAEAVAGKTDFDFLPKDLAERYRADDLKVLHTGEPVIEQEEPLVRADGKPVWLSTTKVALRDQRGDSIGLVGICHDITGRRAAEEKVAGLNRDLERRTRDLLTLNQELEAFSYSVSHDLRAPLRHIDGFAELAVKKAGPSLDEGGRRYLNMIAGSAKEMGQLIDDLLVFSRMGRTDLRAGTVSLDQLVKTVLRDLEPESQGRSVQWKIAELPSVEGDQAMLRVVFVNLLSNALKYTRTRETAEIEIGTKTGRAGETVIFVRDNGVGFDMRYADKLFGVFQRLHSSTDFEGTGIGLANVRRIISRHGGATWAEGVLDRGATVYFSLPPAHIAIAKTETEAVSCPT